MGYTLAIGEAVIVWHEDCVSIGVEHLTLEDAPEFGEPTGKSNCRWPSHFAWSATCRNLEICRVMYNSRDGGADELALEGHIRQPLMPSHPGVAPITIEHVRYIEGRVADYKRRHPDHRAEYPPPKPGAVLCGGMFSERDLIDDPRYDGSLCRAEWLLFWLRWAVDNCKRPVFVCE